MDNENVEEERRAQVPQNPEDDEISLIDLLAVLLRHKWLIIITTVLAMIFAVVYSAISIVLPPATREGGGTAKSMIFINTDRSLQSLCSMLLSNGLVTDFVETDSFLDAVLDEFDFDTRFGTEGHPRAEKRDALKRLIAVEFDDKTSVLTLSFTEEDSDFAKEVADFSIRMIQSMLLDLGVDKNLLEKKNLEQAIENSYEEILNLQKKIQSLGGSDSYGLEASMISFELEAQKEVYTQLKTQYELLKQEVPIFQVIQVIYDNKMSSNKPSRKMLCIIITFAAFFISVFIAFALNAVENIKKDPDAMDKLRSAIKS